MEGLKLNRRVDGFTFTIVCILMKDLNDRADMENTDAVYTNKKDVGELMVINAHDIDGTVGRGG